MRQPIIAGNWKLNKTIPEAVDLVNTLKNLVTGITDREIVIAPTFTALKAVSEVIQGTNICLAAQNIFWEKNGAYTGEISPTMLKDAGCEYVIIGHSERRAYFGETNETVNKKIFAALAEGLLPIVCIGESLTERESGKTFEIIETQIRGGLKNLTEAEMKKIVMAYEPIWAIGTGKTATPEQANEVHLFIRQTLNKMFGEQISSETRIQYGGSVKPENIGELMAQPDIDGALVGGASLTAESFAKLVRY